MKALLLNAVHLQKVKAAGTGCGRKYVKLTLHCPWKETAGSHILPLLFQPLNI